MTIAYNHVKENLQISHYGSSYAAAKLEAQCQYIYIYIYICSAYVCVARATDQHFILSH